MIAFKKVLTADIIASEVPGSEHCGVSRGSGTEPHRAVTVVLSGTDIIATRWADSHDSFTKFVESLGFFSVGCSEDTGTQALLKASNVSPVPIRETDFPNYQLILPAELKDSKERHLWRNSIKNACGIAISGI